MEKDKKRLETHYLHTRKQSNRLKVAPRKGHFFGSGSSKRFDMHSLSDHRGTTSLKGCSSKQANTSTDVKKKHAARIRCQETLFEAQVASLAKCQLLLAWIGTLIVTLKIVTRLGCRTVNAD